MSTEKHSINPRTQSKLYSGPVFSKFSCQCGKLYTNYPALYLHFQRKHKQIISTKVQSSKCLIEEINGQRSIKYFYTDLEDANSLENYIICHWEKAIDHFRKEEMNDYSMSHSSKECIDQLINFIRKLDSSLLLQKKEENIAKELPYYFNDFLLNKSKELSALCFEVWSETLIRFSRWQFQNKYSRITIERNQKYNPI